MSKNRSGNNGQCHVLPLNKAYVKGYYEKRNGKLVWISPYENSKDKQQSDGASKLTEMPQGPSHKPPHFSPDVTPAKPKFIPVVHEKDEKFNFVLEVIVRCVKTIDGFEPGEIVKLRGALKVAKSIVNELGYLDRGIAAVFDPPEKVAQTKLGPKAVRETAAMVKELTRLSRRVTKGTLREKIQRMAEMLGEAL